MDLEELAEVVHEAIEGAYERPLVWVAGGAVLGLLLWSASQAPAEQRGRKSHQFVKHVARLVIDL